ncbi:MAG: helix-turn-helix domain-containing protein [Actinomycetota bacterium]|nr:helix-turn-helix domain-containing protein [Actinomycetota bacterium]
MSEVPDLLTVEEAARYLRIGRTKAYAMTRQWRATGGEAGLPVVDLDNTLRVPRDELEQVIGTKLTVPLAEVIHQAPAVSTAAARGTSDTDTSDAPVVRPTSRRPRTRRADPASQPGLFDTPDPAA